MKIRVSRVRREDKQTGFPVPPRRVCSSGGTWRPPQLGAQRGPRRVGAAVARRLCLLLSAAVHPRIHALPPPRKKNRQSKEGRKMTDLNKVGSFQRNMIHH